MKRFAAYEWIRTAVTIAIALALGYLVLVFTVDDPNEAFKWFLCGDQSAECEEWWSSSTTLYRSYSLGWR